MDAEPTQAARRSSASGFTPLFIAIAGGSAAGKGTVCHRIVQTLGDQRVVIVGTDDFYRPLTCEGSASAEGVNFDSPDAIDIEALARCLDDLRAGQSTRVPQWDFTRHRRSQRTRRVDPAHVVIIEGIFALFFPELLERASMKLFVDTADDVRLVRRIKRDTLERGRSVEDVLAQYANFVKPAFERWVLPSKLRADVIIPWVDDNPVALNLITEHIRAKLSIHDLSLIYSNLHVMPSTTQVRGMHTKIRCHSTDRGDFVFYADRLIRLLVEFALGFLPVDVSTVTTPAGVDYQGIEFQGQLCAVSVIRSGEVMENALRSCCQGVKLGKVLITRSPDGACSVAYDALPHDVTGRHVLVMDPVLSTGNTILRVVDLLTRQRQVAEAKIIVLSLVAAPDGIHRVCKRHPALKVITTEIDRELGRDLGMRPGVGDFGDRYFGTGLEPGESLRTQLCADISGRDRDASPKRLAVVGWPER
ncbi:unnamed protein product [Prorocentrum cordatum]|uniref:uridine/cytidine kinase n=1 Tax=Prorocentrum cordatum TaxID=2364126 RepID=A0ABN9RWC9_9DINO|nr:unnamed protein product [Polarella glacialis]